MSDREPCPACDLDLWHADHVCYTYAEWRERIARHAKSQPQVDG